MNLEATHTVIVVLFWLAVLRVFTRAFLIPRTRYPRSVEWTLGEDVATIVIGAVACAIYAWMLGWLRF